MFTADDYRNAPSGKGPLAGQWADKPHRIAYDMARLVETLTARLAELRKLASERPRWGFSSDEESSYSDGYDTAVDAEIEFLEEILQPANPVEFEGYN